jgi:hypothetical protein
MSRRRVSVLIVIVYIVILMMTVCEATCKLEGGIGTGDSATEFQGHIFIYRAGVRFLFLHAQPRQHVDYDTGLHLKFARQLIDSDFLHRRELLLTPYATVVCSLFAYFPYRIR